MTKTFTGLWSLKIVICARIYRRHKRHKQMSDQHTLARHENIQKIVESYVRIGGFYKISLEHTPIVF
jgi:hypothetical protein